LFLIFPIFAEKIFVPSRFQVINPYNSSLTGVPIKELRTPAIEFDKADSNNLGLIECLGFDPRKVFDVSK
jgi:hypothetical protein